MLKTKWSKFPCGSGLRSGIAEAVAQATTAVCGFDPWPANFDVPQVPPPDKKKNELVHTFVETQPSTLNMCPFFFLKIFSFFGSANMCRFYVWPRS